jgi:toxin-antitoxin system PIN domain toxin
MYLLDSNVLIALAVAEHVHHGSAIRWLGTLAPGQGRPVLALCPITEGALVRQLLRDDPIAGIANAMAILRAIKAWPGCEFWGDGPSYVDIDWRGVIGHRQVTDAYLVGLAGSRNAWLASFDRGLAALRPDVVRLVPTD